MPTANRASPAKEPRPRPRRLARNTQATGRPQPSSSSNGPRNRVWRATSVMNANRLSTRSGWAPLAKVCVPSERWPEQIEKVGLAASSSTAAVRAIRAATTGC